MMKWLRFPYTDGLKGSEWCWEFLKTEEGTVIICTGGSKNLSDFFRAMNDSTQKSSVGINIWSMRTNIGYINE